MEKKSQQALNQALDALGSSINDIVTTALTVEEVVVKTRKPLEFISNDPQEIYGQGLYWKGAGATKQLIYRANPDRIYTTESIDIPDGKNYSISNIAVLTKNELGSSVIKSHLKEVGTLNNLRTQGDVTIDEFIFYNSDSSRFGFGTPEPNASVSFASLDSEFIIDVEGPTTRIGNWTTDDLEILTDDTPRISISSTGKIAIGTNNDSQIVVNGHLGVGINNPPSDTSITTAQGIRFSGTKFETGKSAPDAGSYRKGDIVWNSDPKPTGYVGWICVREGTPGEWKPFGSIAS